MGIHELYNNQKGHNWVFFHCLSIHQVSPLPLADWHEGEPNNWDGNEDCVEFVNDGWNDNSCAREKRKFVCMYGPIIDGQLAEDFFDE